MIANFFTIRINDIENGDINDIYHDLGENIPWFNVLEGGGGYVMFCSNVTTDHEKILIKYGIKPAKYTVKQLEVEPTHFNNRFEVTKCYDYDKMYRLAPSYHPYY